MTPPGYNRSMPGKLRGLLVGVSLVWTAACTQYEYEEEFQLAADGSGTVRISGSERLWRGIHDLEDEGNGLSLAAVGSYYGVEPLRITSLTETERDGQRYLHVQLDFDRIDAFCEHPANRHRHCAFEPLENHNQLRGQFGMAPARVRSSQELADGVASSAHDLDPPSVAFRFHLPSIVQFHNGVELERGNIVRWQTSVEDYLAGEQVPVEVRMDNQSILALTLRIVLISVAIVLAALVLTLAWLYRKGRRQLFSEQQSGRTSPTSATNQNLHGVSEPLGQPAEE